MPRSPYLRRLHMSWLLLPVLAGAIMLCSMASAQDSSCIVCHTDEDLIAEFREQDSGQTPELLAESCGYPLERNPNKDFLVSEEFFDTVHGELECTDCHSGDSTAPDKESAHDGLVVLPSEHDPQGICGECHEEIAQTAPQSLHATLPAFSAFLMKRTSPATWPAVTKARQQHCTSCHASCGACHVSSPAHTGGGLIDGHLFSARPDPVRQCAACHGSRTGSELFGTRGGLGDIHLSSYTMTCSTCHQAQEMHAAAPEGLENRYHLEEAITCRDCHRDLQFGSVREHRIHNNKVQCQVCHAQAYVNCFDCHTGTNDQDVASFVLQRAYEDMKIGYNPDRIPGNNYEFVLLRHVPVNPGLFDNQLKNAFPRFDVAPTWKRTSPHNIQRRTWQNATCNNCHGRRELFLSEKDLLDYEIKANFGIAVPDDQIPPARSRTVELAIDTSRVNNSMLVTAAWLQEHRADTGLVIVDVRDQAEYDKGHIPGAISMAPSLANLRTAMNADTISTPAAAEPLAATLGTYGLTADNKIIVYSDDAAAAGFLLSVLFYAGADDIALLDGGIAAWTQDGYAVTAEQSEPAENIFAVNLRQNMLADNAFITSNLTNPAVVLVDIRALQHSLGFVQQGDADAPARIPGSVLLPASGLYRQPAGLKNPEEMLWLLDEHGITPEKTIVVTCSSDQWAGAAYFALRYLGYPDVRVHDGSRIGLAHCP